VTGILTDLSRNMPRLGGKLQAPTSNIQRSSKFQASTSTKQDFMVSIRCFESAGTAVAAVTLQEINLTVIVATLFIETLQRRFRGSPGKCLAFNSHWESGFIPGYIRGHTKN
jgi:hypothetical protein